jgi:hypothetical protein
MLVCKLVTCPFNDSEGFCLNPVPAIDENGHCAFVWRKGQPKLNLEAIDEVFKRKEKIVDAEEKEDVSTE